MTTLVFFLAVLCLIICIVRTSFGGDSYRVFFLWVPWEVFHMVVCLIIYIVRTSFGGDSYRLVLFLGSLGSLNDSRPAGDNVPTGIRTRDRGDLTSLRLAAGRSDYPRFLFWRYSA